MSTNFIYDNTGIMPTNKRDRQVLAPEDDPTKFVQAAEMNTFVQSVLDVQTWARRVFSVLNYGAKADSDGVGGGFDNLAAFNTTVSIATLLSDRNTGTIIQLPAGRYRLSGQWRFPANCIVVGEGGLTTSGYGRTTLVFDAGVNGIVVDAPATSTTGFDGSNTQLKDICVKSAGGSGGPGPVHGLIMNAKAMVATSTFENFSGDGVHIVANAGGSPSTNASGWHLFKVVSQLNGGNGFFVSGTDANAGNGIACDAEGNTAVGFRDSSSLQNTWHGCQAAGNLRGYQLDNATSRVVLSSCYDKSGQLPSIITAFNQIQNGGSFASGVIGSGSANLDGTLTNFKAASGVDDPWQPKTVYVVNQKATNGGNLYRVTSVAGDATSANSGGPTGTGSGIVDRNVTWAYVAAVQAASYKTLGEKRSLSGTGVHPYETYYSDLSGSNPLATVFNYPGDGSGAYNNAFGWINESSAVQPLLFSLSKTSINAWPTQIEPGVPIIPTGAYVGKNWVDYGSAQPTAGDFHQTWNVGDARRSNHPGVGGIDGWACITSGTLGTYSEGRTATATGSAIITLNTATSVLTQGMLINVGGTTANRIVAVNPDNIHLTMASAVSSASGLAITFSPPTFKLTGYNFGFNFVSDFGADPTGVADCLPAWLNMLTASGLAAGQTGRIIHVPSGTYRFSAAAPVTRSLRLYGEQNGNYGNGVARFKFDAGHSGFVCNGITTSFDGGNAHGSVFENIIIQGQGGSADAYGSHGVYMDVACVLRDCYITGFTGDGVHVLASSGGSPSTNANGWQIWGGFIGSCTRSAIFTQGADANWGTVWGTVTDSCGRYGVEDNSFLGNVYSGLQTASNGIGGYWNTNVGNNRSMFMGCYAEGGMVSRICYPAMVIGGIYGGGFTSDSNAFTLTDDTIGSSFTIMTRASHAGGLLTGVNGLLLGNSGTGVHQFWQLFASDQGEVAPIQHQYNYTSQTPYSGLYGYTWANSNNYANDFLAGDNAVNSFWPMKPDPISKIFLGDVYFHNNRFNFASTVPPAGTWNVGDFLAHSTPTATTILGWRCIQSGTAGTNTDGLTASPNGTTTVSLSGAPTNPHDTIANRGSIVVGSVISIGGRAPNRVTSISGTNIVMANSESTGSGLSIAFAPPVWQPIYIGQQANTATKTADYAMGANDLGLVFSNLGAVAQVNFTLPACIPGTAAHFLVEAAGQNLRITATGGATIALPGTSSAANGHADSATSGGNIKLRANPSGTSWVAETATGVWSVT